MPWSSVNKRSPQIGWISQKTTNLQSLFAFCFSVCSNTLIPAQFRNLCFLQLQSNFSSIALVLLPPHPSPIKLYLFIFVLTSNFSVVPCWYMASSNTTASNSPFLYKNPTNLLVLDCSKLPVLPVRCSPTWSVPSQSLQVTSLLHAYPYFQAPFVLAVCCGQQVRLSGAVLWRIKLFHPLPSLKK